MSSDYRLMHIPSLQKNPYVLVTSRGDFVAVRQLFDSDGDAEPHLVQEAR